MATSEQFTSFTRFVEAGATLLESCNFFLFETADKRLMLVHISPEGYSTVYVLNRFCSIDPRGEALE
jgi:hypothetical protein